MGLISIAELTARQYVVTLWPHGETATEPYHFIANLRDIRKLSLGMWTVGFEFEDLLNSAAPKWVDTLNDLAEKALLPETEEEALY